MQIAKRITLSIVLAVGFLLLLYPACSLLADLLGSKDSFQTLAKKWIFSVIAFYIVGIATVADHLTKGKCNRLTAMVIAAVLVHVAFAFWFRIEALRYRSSDDEQIPFQFAWIIVSGILGALTWLRIRRVYSDSFEQRGEQSHQRFSIASMMVWFSLIGIFLALLTRSPAFPVPWDVDIVIRPKKAVAAATVLGFACLPSTTRWLLRTNRFVFSATGVWLIAFAGSWILYCLIGLTEPGYGPEDEHIVQIFSFSFAAMLYLGWLGIAKRFLFGNVFVLKDQPAPNRFFRVTRWTFTGVTLLLWIYLGFWLYLTFAGDSEERSADWVDRSPLILEEFREVYGAATMEEIQSRHDPKTLEQWSVQLNRIHFPKEQDVIYRIASLSKIHELDKKRYGNLRNLREAMGFTAEEIAALPQEDPANMGSNSDLYPNGLFSLWHEPWTESSKPIFAKYCREKKELFRKIRDAIDDSEFAMTPPSEAGWPAVLAVTRFGTDMLMAEARFAFQSGDYATVMKNVDALAQFEKTLRRSPNLPFFFHNFVEARAISVLTLLLDANTIEGPDLKRIENIVSMFDSPVTETPESRVLALAAAMQHYRSDFLDADQPSYSLRRKPVVVSFIRRFPNCIDWAEFIELTQKEYLKSGTFISEAELEKLTPEELTKLGKRPPASPPYHRFHEQVFDLIALPKHRSRRLANYCISQSSNDPVVTLWVANRVRRIGIELLIYRAKNGNYPETLAEVNGPIRDPFTGNDLGYFIEKDRFQLWSSGPNQDIEFMWPAK